MDGRLVFGLGEENLTHCIQPGRMTEANRFKTYHYNISVTNRGNLPVEVSRVGIGASLDCNSTTGVAISPCGML